MPTHHPDAEIITQLADEAVADHGVLSPDEIQALREFGLRAEGSIRDAATTTLGQAAGEASVDNAAFAVHSGYNNGRRA